MGKQCLIPLVLRALNRTAALALIPQSQHLNADVSHAVVERERCTGYVQLAELTQLLGWVADVWVSGQVLLQYIKLLPGFSGTFRKDRDVVLLEPGKVSRGTR